MSKQFYVYIHKKPDGTPFYVGKGHGKRAYNFYRRSEWHKNIVAKYGQSNIIIEIINCLNELQAFDLEKIYIKQFKLSGVCLVNLTDGGEGTSGLVRGHPSDDHKKKNGDARRGKKQSEETKRKRSDALKGKKRTFTAEWRQNISTANKGRISPRKGVKLSDETIEKIRLSKMSAKTKEIYLQKKQNMI